MSAAGVRVRACAILLDLRTGVLCFHAGRGSGRDRPGLRGVGFSVAFHELHAHPSEDVVHEALGERDLPVRRHALRLEPLVGELRDEALDGDAVLQGHADGRAEAVHQAADGRAFLGHGDEELARCTVLVHADGEVALVAGHVEVVGEAAAGVFEPTTHGAFDDSLDDPFHHAGLDFTGGDPTSGLRDVAGDFGGCRGQFEFVFAGVFVQVRRRARRVERLAQLAAVPVEGVRLQAELPALPVGVGDVLDRGLVGEVDGLGDRTGDERLRCGHHPDVAGRGDVPLPVGAALVGTIEDREVLVEQARGTFDRLRAADDGVQFLDLAPGQSQQHQSVEGGIHSGGLDVDAERLEDMLGHVPGRERETEFEHHRQLVGHREQIVLGVALAAEEVPEQLAVTFVRDAFGHRDVQRQGAHDVADDEPGGILVVAECMQGRSKRLVGDLEVAAARKLLELGEGEVRLDAGGVAVHQQTDRSRGGDDGHLGVAEAVLLADLHRFVPRVRRHGEHLRGVRDAHGTGSEPVVIDRHRTDVQGLPLVGIAGHAVGRPTVVADHAEHVLLVLVVSGERTQLAGHAGAHRVGAAGEDGRHRTADRAAVVGVVGDARLHEHGAQVGEPESEGTEAVAQFGDLPRRECGHEHRDLEDHGPHVDRMRVVLDVEGAVLAVVELQQVDRRQVAGGVVEEHVLAAGVGCVDASRLRAGVPLVDGGVVLDAGVGAVPRCGADLVPEVAGGDRLGDVAVGPTDEVPLGIGVHGAEELAGQTDRVVGVLTGDRLVGLAVEVVVEVEAELLGQFHLLGGQVLEALDQRADLEFLANLPVHERLDVRVVGIQAHHLGGPAGGAARLDGARGAVADLEEAHQSRALAAAGERFPVAADVREVRPGAGTVLEESGLTGPEIHDAAFADQIIVDGLDEAGVGLRMGVGVVGQHGFAGGRVVDPVALGRAGDSVRPVQSGVEPLGAVGSRDLMQHHPAQFVVEGVGVLGGVEVAVLLAPGPPAAGQTVDDLSGGSLRTGDGSAVVGDHGRAVVLVLGYAGLAEVLADHDVRGQLAPLGRNPGVVHLEHHGSVRVRDPTGSLFPFNRVEDVLSLGRESSLYVHLVP